MLGRLDGALTGPRAGRPGRRRARLRRRPTPTALGLDPADLADAARGAPRRRSAASPTCAGARRSAASRCSTTTCGRASTTTAASSRRAAPRAPGSRPRRDAGAVRRRRPAPPSRSDVGVDRAATVTCGPSGPRRETTFSTGDRAALVLFGDTGGRAPRLAAHLPGAGRTPGTTRSSTRRPARVLRRANMANARRRPRLRQLPRRAATAATQRPWTLDPYLTDPAAATTLSRPERPRVERHRRRLGEPVARGAAADRGGRARRRTRSTTSRRRANGVGACDAAHLCSWNGGVGGSWETNREQNAVQAFWYVNRFHDHLAAAPIGFNAASGHFEGDDARVERRPTTARPPPAALPDADHLDNANMTTPPDGQSPVCRCTCSQPVPPPNRRRSATSTAATTPSIVYHEYTHGLSNRLITDARRRRRARRRAVRRRWARAGATGTPRTSSSTSPQPDTAARRRDRHGRLRRRAGQHPIRTAADRLPASGCRRAAARARRPAPAATPTATSAAISAAPRASHADGEIWGETLWDLRKAARLATSPRRSSPAGMRLLAAAARRSSTRATRSCRPTRALFGGIHINALWGVFADRGMGFLASTAGRTTPRRVQTARPPAGRDARARAGRGRAARRRRRSPRAPSPARGSSSRPTAPGRRARPSAGARPSPSAARPPAARPRR